MIRAAHLFAIAILAGSGRALVAQHCPPAKPGAGSACGSRPIHWTGGILGLAIGASTRADRWEPAQLSDVTPQLDYARDRNWVIGLRVAF
jgi:hypothetical protein